MHETTPRHGIRELAELTGTKLRTLRRWVHSGAISSTDFRGPATSYGARHVDEARAVKRLLAENLSLEAIRARLTRLSDDELARFVQPEPVAGGSTAAASEAAALDAPALAGATTTGTLEKAPTGPEATCARECWEHVTLLPGLKLLVRGDSGALVLRIAQEIQDRYGVGKS
jgi:DNA-binding transcriptional MerR regulator